MAQSSIPQSSVSEDSIAKWAAWFLPEIHCSLICSIVGYFDRRFFAQAPLRSATGQN
jgi:hypothetical protein